VAGIVKIVKNWVPEPRRTGRGANESPASAIVGAEPSKHSPLAVVTANSECQTAYNRKLGGLSGFSVPKYPPIMRLQPVGRF
jgi:hypothetical protein